MKITAIYKLICIFALALVLNSSSASACPDDQYESCVFTACVCLPKMGGDVGNAAEHLKNEIRGQTGGLALEQWIIASRNSAIGSSQPIPPQIRRALTGHVEEDILNRARFKIGDNGILNLAGLSIAYGDRVFGNEVSAVTLIDVIVFRNAGDAYNNVSLWRHELEHLKQFSDWGTRDFAIRYARNSNDVEGPAYAAQNSFSALPIPVDVGQPIIQPGFPVFGNFCTTPFGRFGPGPTNPIGSPCNVATPNGPIFGQVTQ